MLKKLLIYYHTLKHLKPIQIYGRLLFRIYRPYPKHKNLPTTRQTKNKVIDPCRRPSTMKGNFEFDFLNLKANLLSTNNNWDSCALPKLWRYNLHYFDDLNSAKSYKRKLWHRDMIIKWINENPVALGTGWEPYPVSLRVVNWIKWILLGNEPERRMIKSLVVQTRWLRKRLEYHLLGNHLLANAKALTTAGLFFQGEEADDWYKIGVKILEKELPEQVLSDGGHFERSTMYHLIIIEDLLDILNFHNVYEKSWPSWWDECVDKMMAWSWVMRHPDGEIPFFNDAAFGVAPSPDHIDDYAQRMGIGTIKRCYSKDIVLGHSGYARLELGVGVLFADIGPVGPDYLPAHAHADTLSFELSIGKQRVCVNSGTSTYEISKLRFWQRSTRAHNTAQIDNENSSQTWSAFRVARRARVVIENFQSDKDEIKLSAVHDGYSHLPGKPVHRRTWKLCKSGLTIEDEFEGNGRHTVEIFFHFHPKILARKDDTNCCIMLIERETNKLLAVIHQLEKAHLLIGNGSWYPEFGKSEPNQYCVIRSESHPFPLKFSISIDWCDSALKEITRRNLARF